jgi:diadenosine tetraphosphate (Ap4A) HIT family hydrolase
MTRTLNESNTPWDDVLVETRDYVVYRDAYPVTEGHVLFVPEQEDWQHVTKCWEAAYRWGTDWVDRGYCDAFHPVNVVIHEGEAARHTVKYPHIHLIPRRAGDMSDPRGGVRHVIPHMGNYKSKGEDK